MCVCVCVFCLSPQSFIKSEQFFTIIISGFSAGFQWSVVLQKYPMILNNFPWLSTGCQQFVFSIIQFQACYWLSVVLRSSQYASEQVFNSFVMVLQVLAVSTGYTIGITHSTIYYLLWNQEYIKGNYRHIGL